jgi:hypothetical protein
MQAVIQLSFPLFFSLHLLLLAAAAVTLAAGGDTEEKRPGAAATINWDELDDLAPEWGSSDSGLEDLLSLSNAYWEPGLGPRAPRRVPSAADLGDGDQLLFDEGGVMTSPSAMTSSPPLDELRESGGGETPSAPQLNDLMHQAMQTVNSLIYNLEKDKGESKIISAAIFRITLRLKGTVSKKLGGFI